MGKTRDVVFMDPGAKVNSSYYCNIVLEKGLLPDIRTIVVIIRAGSWSPRALRLGSDLWPFVKHLQY